MEGTPRNGAWAIEKPRDQVCGCCGPGKPMFELRHLLDMLERQEVERKQREEREKKRAALPTWPECAVGDAFTRQ